MNIQISSLHYYPIKACAGTDLFCGELDARGFKHDRAWMLVDEAGRQLTQRELPALALVKPVVGVDDSLTLSAPAKPSLALPCDLSGAVKKVEVWQDECVGIDQGDLAAQWFSSFLKRQCRLVLMEKNFERRVDEKRLPDRVFVTGFADGYPLLLTSIASLAALNQKLPSPVLMNRFRPNIVVDGCAAFEEDSWKRIQINNIVFRLVKPCARCQVVCINQEEAVRSQEPLGTLASFRNFDGKVLFGQNLAHETPGVLSVGDSVAIIE